MFIPYLSKLLIVSGLSFKLYFVNIDLSSEKYFSTICGDTLSVSTGACPLANRVIFRTKNWILG